MALPKKKKKKKFSDDLWALTKMKYHLSSRQIELRKNSVGTPKDSVVSYQLSQGHEKSLWVSSLNRAITKDFDQQDRYITDT